MSNNIIVILSFKRGNFFYLQYYKNKYSTGLQHYLNLYK